MVRVLLTVSFASLAAKRIGDGLMSAEERECVLRLKTSRGKLRSCTDLQRSCVTDIGASFHSVYASLSICMAWKVGNSDRPGLLRDLDPSMF